MILLAIISIPVAADSQEGRPAELDDAYLEAMQMDEEDERDDTGSESSEVEAASGFADSEQTAPADPANALKDKIDDIVDWAPEQDLDCD